MVFIDTCSVTSNDDELGVYWSLCLLKDSKQRGTAFYGVLQ